MSERFYDIFISYHTNDSKALFDSFVEVVEKHYGNLNTPINIFKPTIELERATDYKIGLKTAISHTRGIAILLIGSNHYYSRKWTEIEMESFASYHGSSVIVIPVYHKSMDSSRPFPDFVDKASECKISSELKNKVGSIQHVLENTSGPADELYFRGIARKILKRINVKQELNIFNEHHAFGATMEEAFDELKDKLSAQEKETVLQKLREKNVFNSQIHSYNPQLLLNMMNEFSLNQATDIGRRAAAFCRKFKLLTS